MRAAAMLLSVAGTAALSSSLPSLPTGESSHTITVGLRQRTFIVQNPTPGTSPRGLVLVFHGFTQTARSICSMANVASVANSEGFIGVCPQGVSNSWNAGGCCGTAQLTGVDDVAFARAVVSYIQARASVDAAKVFATGFSNGGMISYRLGCQASDVFTGIAPVAGQNYGNRLTGFTCRPDTPRSVVHWHGTADLLQSYRTSQTHYANYANDMLGCGSLTRVAYSNPLYFGLTCHERTTCPSGRSGAWCSTSLSHIWPRNSLLRSWNFLTGQPMSAGAAANATDGAPAGTDDAQWENYL